MTRKLKFPLVTIALVALTSGFAVHAAAGAPSEAGSTGDVSPHLPFKGTFDGLHASRTPLVAPFVFDRFEANGEATHLGRFELVIESTVNFGIRPVRGAGTHTFVAANGDRLVANQTGVSALVRPGTVLITEHSTVDPDSSTGRFAGAQGTFTVERLADAATGVGGVTAGSFEGTISLAPPSEG